MLDWLNNPALKNMDPAKKELFKLAASQVEGKSGNAMAPVMMSLIMNANKKGIHFTPDEISLILQVLKQGKSPAEQQSIDQTVQMVQTMMKSKKRQPPKGYLFILRLLPTHLLHLLQCMSDVFLPFHHFPNIRHKL